MSENKNAPVPKGTTQKIKINNTFDPSKHKMVLVARGVYKQAPKSKPDEEVIAEYNRKIKENKTNR